MNAPFDQSKDLAFEAALTRAQGWRGQCIQQFARLEIAIGDALQCIAAAKPTLKVKRADQIRAAFDEMKRLTDSKGPFGSKFQLAKSLHEIDRWIDWRAHLTHGVLNVWQGPAGKWLLTLEHRDLGGSDIRMHSISRDSADEMLARLGEEVGRLERRVRSMREALETKLP
jgi:hypothetical protein